MRARVIVRLVAVLSVPLAAACDGPTEGAPVLVVENAAGISISEVFIRDCPVKFWGDNRLDSMEVITPGRRRAFDVGEGCYDVLVFFSTAQTIDRHNVEVPTGQRFVWVVQNPDPVLGTDVPASIAARRVATAAAPR